MIYVNQTLVLYSKDANRSNTVMFTFRRYPRTKRDCVFEFYVSGALFFKNRLRDNEVSLYEYDFFFFFFYWVFQ